MSFTARLRDYLGDLAYGVSTRGKLPSARPGAVYYATAHYHETRRVLKNLSLNKDDVFIDVGAGKGRVLCVAARHKIKKVIGVEYSTELVAIASENIKRARGLRAPVQVIAIPAEEFDFREATAFYFFNPFEPGILESVLEKISSVRGSRSIRIAFVMESRAQKAVFEQQDWLERYDYWPGGHNTSFYRTRNDG